MIKRRNSRNQKSNYQINLHFLKKYNTENGTNLSASLLENMAYQFSSWEEEHVCSLENGYEHFRNEVIWLDYDEILEMYIENIAHPSIKPSWQSDSNYSFFKNNILPQMGNL